MCAWKIANTFWGEEVINTAKMCSVKGCNQYADNAGNGRYHDKCSFHHKSKYGMGGFNYKNYRKDYCENIDGRLGYICESKIVAPRWQLEVDHIDGDNTNNDPANLQTLCANCHRYKTMLNEENLPKHKRKSFFTSLLEKEKELNDA